jgi:hypothetical protein
MISITAIIFISHYWYYLMPDITAIDYCH